MAEKKMGTQTKASMRNGRAKKSGEVYNANHNTLEKTRRGQLHIDETKFELNRYYQFNMPGKRGKVHYGGDGGFDSRKHEKRMYEHLFGAGIEARNERYIKSGHREDCLDVGDVYSNPKTAPLETILQIGNSKMIAEGIMTSEEMREKLLAAFEQTVKDLMEIGKGHVFPLSAALHCEEAVPHIHFRVAMGSTDKFGHFVANQSAADYNSTIRETVKRIGKEGLQVEYESTYLAVDGQLKHRRRRLDSAVRQNVLDGIRQVQQKAQELIGEEIGADGVDITAHPNSAPDHEPVQGRGLTLKTSKGCSPDLTLRTWTATAMRALSGPLPNGAAGI